jgi:GDSL-like lipase/acylhydrolase family protein
MIAPQAEPRESRMRGIVFRVIAVLIGVLGAALIAEVGLRLGGYSRTYVNPVGSFHEGDPLLGWRGKPNFEGRFRLIDFDVLIALDANGFRRQEHQTPLAQSRHKVLVFGDSFVWGWGVSQGEGFTDQMSLAMPGYSVINFGLSGAGTLHEEVLFEKYGLPLLAPGDTVLLTFFGNDFDDNMAGLLRAEVSDGQVRLVGPVKQLRRQWRLKYDSYFVNLLVYAADRISLAIKLRRHRAHWAAEWAKRGDQSAEVIVLRHFLGKFRDACAAKRARFVVVYVPERGELGEVADPTADRLAVEQAYRRAFFDSAQALGIHTIDLLPDFLAARKADGPIRIAFPHDEHWTPSGHALAARLLSRYILDADRAAAASPPDGSGGDAPGNVN